MPARGPHPREPVLPWLAPSRYPCPGPTRKPGVWSRDACRAEDLLGTKAFTLPVTPAPPRSPHRRTDPTHPAPTLILPWVLPISVGHSPRVASPWNLCILCSISSAPSSCLCSLPSPHPTPRPEGHHPRSPSAKAGATTHGTRTQGLPDAARACVPSHTGLPSSRPQDPSHTASAARMPPRRPLPLTSQGTNSAQTTETCTLLLGLILPLAL